MDRPMALLDLLQTILESSDNRMSKAQHIAEAIRLAGDYHWVGIYDVSEKEIAIIARSGAGAPTFPRFPVTQGLNGAAVASRSTIIVNDVANDPRYLTTFGSTQSEMIVPVINPATGTVVGTIDVESVNKNAFADNDSALLEECARAITRLWDSTRVLS
jgi:GAF domain-containing protein